MSTDGESARAKPKFSVLRSILLALLGGAIVWGWMSYTQASFQDQAAQSTTEMLEGVFRLGKPVENRLSAKFQDKNSDLVADPPANNADCLKPETLHFSFIASEDVQKQAELWKPLSDALAKETGLSVEYFGATDVDQQLEGLRTGELHVTCLNTGAVPMAVNSAGFVPVSALTDAKGQHAYSMQIVVPAGSDLQKIQDLKGKRLTFTERNSNSGFKAPVVLLAQDFGLMPGTDYDFAFSTSHMESIERIASGELQAAPIASDMLGRYFSANPEAKSTLRAIYTSETFPTATFGYLHHLSPEIAEPVKRVLADFSFAGTALEEEFATSEAVKLSPVSYKEDWSVIRRIDDAMGIAHPQQ